MHIRLTRLISLDHPFLHPAASHRPTPYILEPYNVDLYPHCLGRTFQHLSHLDTVVGKIIQGLVAPGGVTESALVLLIQDNVGCPVCRCMFSRAGFLDHAPEGKCKNHGDGSISMCLPS